ncbi:MAG: hypothetical protein HY569_02420 [Candidatus Magasanikbacteria bacterium]|nr:hypothetical protein [Candidatus Magasanikbacteria bacterium]
MVTKLIGVREFRQNIASYYRKSIRNDWRFLIMNRNQPIFEVRPIRGKNATLEKLYADIAKAREDYKQGRYYTAEEMRKQLGID